MSDPLTRVLNEIQKVTGKEAKRNGNGWTASCPAHDDTKPSLSICEGDDGRVLLHCHVGCAFNDIVFALGLAKHELMPNRVSTKSQASAKNSSNRQKSIFKTAREAIEAYERKLGKHSVKWQYHVRNGEVVFHVVRWNLPDGGKEIRPVSRTKDCDGWQMTAMEGPRPLYGLLGIQESDGPVYVVEGEKCAESMRELGFTATTSAGGSKATAGTDWEPLAGREVYIIPDNDDPGRKYMRDVARILATKVATPTPSKRIEIENPDGDDIFDMIEALRGKGVSDDAIREEIQAVTSEAKAIAVKARRRNSVKPNDEENENKSRSHAQLLLEIADGAGVELFRDAGDGDDAFVAIPVDEYVETFKLPSNAVTEWLQYEFYRAYSQPPSEQGVRDAVAHLKAKAKYVGKAERVGVRVMGDENVVWVDLCDEAWRCVRIDADGWKVVEGAPVRFVRHRGMKPLPIPQRGGRIDELQQFVNAGDDDAFALMVAWLVGIFSPSGPYPVLVINGEQGSAKSTTCRILRELADPNGAPIRAMVREARDLAISANNARVLTYDNVSSIPAWLSDALCRLSTGGGFSTRELYSDASEMIFNAKRPILLNGIPDFVGRPDLLERSIVLTLPSIGKRCPEKQLWAAFDEAKPRILGAILDAVSAAIRNLATTDVADLPRMADFAMWIVAAESALGWPAGRFMAAYADLREQSTMTAIEHSPIGSPVLAYLNAKGKWNGTATKLLDEISSEAYTPDRSRKRREFPSTANALSNQLKRMAPELRRLGWDVSFPRSATSRTIVIEKIGSTSSSSSSSSRSSLFEPKTSIPNDDRVTVDDDCKNAGSSPQNPPEGIGIGDHDGCDDDDDLLRSPRARPRVPDGWSSAMWADELLRKADACETTNPDIAAKYRDDASRIQRKKLA